MEKRLIDPWKWGKNTNSIQAVEVTNVAGTLYCSGQVALDENGKPSNADMNTQLAMAIQNLEELILTANYDMRNIVRLNIYTISIEEFFTTCMNIYIPFLQKHQIEQATTLIEINGLFSTLSIELEATVVK